MTYVANGMVSHNTIGLMMDCDTTGVEPDLALVKFKKLVGGGSMQIVNQTVPRALRNLGYQAEQIEAIVEYIAEHGHVVDAPGLRPEHYEVFDCAMGERAISAMGHVRMMAAVQPALSGAISKTVNLPESATVEDIESIYLQGWKLGLKALAVYRDNCKVGQPLSDARKKTEVAPAEADTPPHENRPVRRRLPKNRSATVTRFAVAGAEGYITASKYPDDGVGELFLKLGKQGSTLAGVMDAFSMAISISLQYGVPLEKWVEKFTNMRFEPAGITDDPDIRIASSVLDYVFRRLALDHLPYETRSEMGILSASERSAQLAGEDPAALAEEQDPGEMAQSAAVERPQPRHEDRAGRTHGRAGQPAAQLDRADRGAARPHRGRPAVPDLRHQDAPGGQLLRLRRLRRHQRLQLKMGHIGSDATAGDASGCAAEAKVWLARRSILRATQASRADGLAAAGTTGTVPRRRQAAGRSATGAGASARSRCGPGMAPPTCVLPAAAARPGHARNAGKQRTSSTVNSLVRRLNDHGIRPASQGRTLGLMASPCSPGRITTG